MGSGCIRLWRLYRDSRRGVAGFPIRPSRLECGELSRGAGDDGSAGARPPQISIRWQETIFRYGVGATGLRTVDLELVPGCFMDGQSEMRQPGFLTTGAHCSLACLATPKSPVEGALRETAESYIPA